MFSFIVNLKQSIADSTSHWLHASCSIIYNSGNDRQYYTTGKYTFYFYINDIETAVDSYTCSAGNNTIVDGSIINLLDDYPFKIDCSKYGHDVNIKTKCVYTPGSNDYVIIGSDKYTNQYLNFNQSDIQSITLSKNHNTSSDYVIDRVSIDNNILSIQIWVEGSEYEEYVNYYLDITVIDYYSEDVLLSKNISDYDSGGSVALEPIVLPSNFNTDRVKVKIKYRCGGLDGTYEEVFDYVSALKLVTVKSIGKVSEDSNVLQIVLNHETNGEYLKYVNLVFSIDAEDETLEQPDVSIPVSEFTDYGVYTYTYNLDGLVSGCNSKQFYIGITVETGWDTESLRYYEYSESSGTIDIYRIPNTDNDLIIKVKTTDENGGIIYKDGILYVNTGTEYVLAKGLSVNT